MDEGKAYLQNADTNAYLEARFENIDVSGPISAHNASATAHSDIRAAVNNAVAAANSAASAAANAQSAADSKAPASHTHDDRYYTETETLAGATKSMFGLGSSAVPNDVFAFLGQYNTHWWSVLHGEGGPEYQEARVQYDGTDSAMFADGSSNRTITYAKSITVDKTTGAITLVNPQTISINGSSLTSINSLVAQAPVYVTNLFTYGAASSSVPNKIYYLPSGTTVSSSGSPTIHYASKQLYIYDGASVPAYSVTSKIVNVPPGEITYEHSTDRNAYPDSGTVDGLVYRYLGVPFQNAVIAPRIATGSYTGTGVYGSSNKNCLTFDVVPKIVFVVAKEKAMFHGYETTLQEWIILVNGMTKCLTKQASNNSGTGTTTISWSGNTVSWYGAWAGAQQNTSGVEYLYVAFG